MYKYWYQITPNLAVAGDGKKLYTKPNIPYVEGTPKKMLDQYTFHYHVLAVLAYLYRNQLKFEDI